MKYTKICVDDIASMWFTTRIISSDDHSINEVLWSSLNSNGMGNVNDLVPKWHGKYQ